MCQRIDRNQSDDDSALHIEDAWTERASPPHAKGHLLGRAETVDRVQMSEDQNLACASRNPDQARRIRGPSDPQVIAFLLSGEILDLRSAPPPFLRNHAPEMVHRRLRVRGRFAAREAFE